MISLKKFEAGDIQRLIDWVPDADFLLQWSGPQYVYPLDVEQLTATLEKTKGAHPPHFMFKAMQGGDVVGHIELMRVDYVEKKGVLARVLIGARQYRGQGWGKMMIQLALDFAFQDLTLKNIDLGVFKFNNAAIQCYEQLGFKTYKITPSLKDENWSLLRMKLDRNDWKK
ncbi:MAG: GNAT family N-acetyltransferase [Candidatus Marinimicrobia bacterium]|jgi:RimJ/RimL family protein N-acetyltransferase|nr:GNAT family N-acetyltransferase [Candidatus Neomarinimicrobiota bacterium]MBT3632180.1 GNAT family N-acetyltransferase [Candidatus Neomarinimicrobiota bacterium]MBT3824335.1 GNAT family N-acetyltransferase [Candidatus Neomarinimicrobiota bacterium]MBT4130048.1 GNAT family N-acetyltransferase [Candidatus Neomarinimicrobiota bacterium]MBT4295035.1 GNAT family N-acetyltransferase [Candidatus Neomarinimicrobiota bacterium]